METEFAEQVFMQKVLIIEDHADMRELLIWQVELMGYIPYRYRGDLISLE